tara:strand:- start:148 stop:561 length:414 start_codon:yes stop_codon:yes gene_type:complete
MLRTRKAMLLWVGIGILISGCSPTIQRKINVAEKMTQWSKIEDTGSVVFTTPGNYLDRGDNMKLMTIECLKSSINQKTFDKLLEKGGKIITTSNWSQGVTLESSRDNTLISYPGTCIGTTYIIEGKKALLDKYYPSK